MATSIGIRHFFISKQVHMTIIVSITVIPKKACQIPVDTRAVVRQYFETAMFEKISNFVLQHNRREVFKICQSPLCIFLLTNKNA